jgi:peptidoglycan/LPS O-acetylase OafA/YrhL
MTLPTAGPYRPDIDGLRAVAVVAVMFFHASVPGFEGGYVGVDVFFVLSGYLITAQLLNASGTSIRSMLAQFYVRRARRILPTLSVVMAAVLATTVILFLPNDLARLGRDATLSLVFAGNIAAWTSAAYFQASPHVPLLHLWTIGIEEQFYLLFPLSLLVAMRYLGKGRLDLAIGACALVSFGICIWGADAHPVANFYFAPPRAWELLLGATLAVRAPQVTDRRTRELLAAGAGMAILCTILLYDADMKYPHFATLVPCAATVVLIALGARNPTLTNRVLSLRPLVFVGLISYSLYLWHVPVLSILEYYAIRKLTTVQTLGWACATFVLAVASWIFIEKPIRERRVLRPNRRFVVCMGSVTLVLATVGMLYWRSAGLPQRVPESLQGKMDGRSRFHADTSRCMAVTPPQLAVGELCHYGSSESSARRFVVWGDSHALALLPAFESLAVDHNASLYFAGVPACRPLIGVASQRQRETVRRRCEEYNAAMLTAIGHLDPDVVVLASYWTHPDMDLVPTGTFHGSNDELFTGGLRSVLERPEMQGRITCAVLDVPRFDYSVPDAYGRAVRRGIDTDFIAMDRATALEQLAPAEDILESMQALGVLRLSDPKQLLCDEHTCRFDLPTGELLYGDDNHLSVNGAHFVAPALEPCFQ